MSHRRKEERRRQLEASVKRNRNNSEAHANLASFRWLELGDFTGAVEEYELCLAITPTHIECLNQLGLVYKNKQKMDMAEALFWRAAACTTRSVAGGATLPTS